MEWKRAKKTARYYRGAIAIAALGVAAAIAFNTNVTSLSGKLGQTASATMFITPRDEPMLLGETGTLDVQVTSDVPINAVGATMSFDPEALEIVGISKEDSFLDLWTEETSIREDAGEIHFSGGTVRKDGVQGTATILTLAIRPKREGETDVSIKEAQVLASDGKGTAIENERRTLTLNVKQKDRIETPAFVPGDFNGDGYITLSDLYHSLLTMEPFSAYDKRNDHDKNGIVNLADISIFFQLMQR